ncbi:MAG: Uncharacterized protein G01um101466_357 [Parcubacteria group bacterium Gr01-1014_66]|nr:MAG: Uncharacterized protein G01um101466_357 [Parcubacteria group bacterium Gr01-1014_66]
MFEKSKEHLPGRRRKFFWYGIFACLSLIFLFGRGALKAQQAKNVFIEDSDAETRAQLNQDNDNDGLRDWEEVLFRSDPHNPDTDGDGTKDNDEIISNRNPLVAGPDDRLATTTLLTRGSSAYYPINFTKALAQSIGEKYILPALYSGQNLHDLRNVREKIVGELLKAATILAPDPLTKNDLAIDEDNSKQAIARYAHESEKIIYKTFAGVSSKLPIEFFGEALQKEELTTLTEIDPYITALESAIIQLKTLATPSSLQNLRLEYLNLLSRTHLAVTKMRNAEEDFVGALIATREYAELHQQLISNLKEFNHILSRAGIPIPQP